jgi:hypothetical protein
MRRNHAQEDPIEGFSTEGLPGIGPGGLMTQPDGPIAPPPPRLCEAGPCVNYHRLAIQLDVETAKAQSIEPGGKASGLPDKMPFHVRVHHYCYPTVGVETELGSLPVLECNRWQPKTNAEICDDEQRQRKFMEGAAGLEYQAAHDAWEAARAAELESVDDELATWIAMNLRDGDEVEIAADEVQVSRVLATHVDDSARLMTKASVLVDHGPGLLTFSIMRTDTLGARYSVQTLTLEIA